MFGCLDNVTLVQRAEADDGRDIPSAMSERPQPLAALGKYWIDDERSLSGMQQIGLLSLRFPMWSSG